MKENISHTIQKKKHNKIFEKKIISITKIKIIKYSIKTINI